LNWKLADLDWKRLLEMKQEEVFGLDIGSSTVKMVQLRKDDHGYTVTAAGSIEVNNSDDDSPGQREANVVNAICQCLQSAGIQTQLAVCGVWGPEVAIRQFQFPPLSPEEIKGAVLLEASQVCPFNIDNAGIDYQLMPDGDNNVRGILVAATKKVIEKQKQTAKNASLKTVLIDVGGLALLNCFSECEKNIDGQITAILNVGSSYTSLAIMKKDTLPFIREMTYGGRTIIQEIADENDVSTEIVKELLTGCNYPSQPEFDLDGGFRKACRKLSVDVIDTLRYYTNKEDSTAIEKIFVCGSFALAKNFIEILNNQLPNEAVMWNPFDRIRCDVDPKCEDMLRKKGPTMAVATGLAMRSI